MQNESSKIVILGTGGTLAGAAADPGDNVGYRAAQIGVDRIVAAIPALAAFDLQTEQIAQIDSKDMTLEVWRKLAASVAYHVERSDVAGVVITHGTDTLEETAYLLQRVLAPDKPVVLTAAMRPTTSLQSDGAQNLLDAVRVARLPGARGVVAVVAGRVMSALDVRKVHTYRLDAFASGDAGDIGVMEEGWLTPWRAWPEGAPLGLAVLARERPPRVAIVMNHGDADGAIVDALRAHGIDGIVVAGTGNGSLSKRLEAALERARREGGVQVLRCTRVAGGAVLPTVNDVFEAAGALTPGQARIELLLRLLAAG
ncbi:MAG TPA: asparaginase [Burkholderiaceae bacterium]|nr:asparaginase [Burkholderiaceae bacterium]